MVLALMQGCGNVGYRGILRAVANIDGAPHILVGTNSVRRVARVYRSTHAAGLWLRGVVRYSIEFPRPSPVDCQPSRNCEYVSLVVSMLAL